MTPGDCPLDVPIPGAERHGDDDDLLRALSGRPEAGERTLVPEAGDFRIKGSPRLSVREPNGPSYSEDAGLEPGRTPPSTRPLLQHEINPIANAPLSTKDLVRIQGYLTQRDEAILSTLRSYRYLNLRQLERLFFPSSRSAQIRLKDLKDHGLLHRWKVIEPPGITRRPSVFLLTARGARVLAAARGGDPRPLVRQTLLVQRHCLNVVHDLEANGFFIALAIASRSRADQGLYHWVGEAEARIHYREGGRSKRTAAAPASDGWGRYLTAFGEIVFDLEWDRGTESLRRLEDKIRSYIAYFKDRQGAELRHVLFVVPGLAREEALLKRIEEESPMFALSCCRFWVTNRPYLLARGALGHIWLYAKPKKEPAAGGQSGWRAPAAAQRLSLLELSAGTSRLRDVRGCIGKPGWWTLRPGGADGP
jgi:hypothetical protein